VIVELFSSSLPANELYSESALPRAGAEPTQSRETATALSARRSQAQTRALEVPRRQPGMELAYALLVGSEPCPGMAASGASLVESNFNQGEVNAS